MGVSVPTATVSAFLLLQYCFLIIHKTGLRYLRLLDLHQTRH